jgi:chondroitin AC lyase
MIRRAFWDHAAQGREISRPGAVGISSDLDQVLSSMINMGTSRQAEFQTFLDHIRGNNDSSLVGNKHFWLSDYHAHRRADYYVGVKMSSPRALSHEAGNGENLQGYYLSQGAVTIMRDGLEYDDIYPVWDWGRIPGVTSPHKDPAPKPPDWRVPGVATFAGGASDGTYGTVGFDFSWDGAWGKKAWFFFDDEVVALGTGLGGSASEPIYSSVNQSLKRGSINVSYDSGSGSSLGTGEHTLSSPLWVHHDQVGYVFPNASVVKLKNADQSGSWQEINNSKSSSMITKSVFSLWFDHGVEPTDQRYAYIMVPGASLAAVQSYANSLPVRIISNNSQQQAVRNDTLAIAGIVFYAPGTVTVRPGLSVESDSKCIVLVNEAGSELKVTAAHPENAETTVNITLSGDLDKTLVFNLPTGRFAGSSMTLLSTGAPVDPAISVTPALFPGVLFSRSL